jgi:hypothetical protein
MVDPTVAVRTAAAAVALVGAEGAPESEALQACSNTTPHTVTAVAHIARAFCAALL